MSEQGYLSWGGGCPDAELAGGRDSSPRSGQQSGSSLDSCVQTA